MVPLHFQRPQPAKAGFRFGRLHLCPLAPLLHVIRVHGHKFEPQARAKLTAACTNQFFLISLSGDRGFRRKRFKFAFKTIEEVKSNLPIYNLGPG